MKIEVGKLRRGAVGVISTLSNDSTFVTMIMNIFVLPLWWIFL
jgi:hypothetical protein